MQALILHPTDICQWHAIIGEAQQHSQVLLSEDMESYLVFLLMRFCKQEKLIESVIALDFLDSMQGLNKTRVEKLQAIGDKSLLFCSLFPGMAIKRRVNLNYFADLGQSAYYTAAAHNEHPFATLFAKLSSQFLELKQVLQALNYHVFIKS